MVDALLDTNIIVDLLNAHPPATKWVHSRQLRLDITSVTWMEVTYGAQNKIKRDQAFKFMKQFDMFYLIEIDQECAMKQLFQHRLQYGIDVLDCLIAAPCNRLQLPIYTRNLKHFAPLLGTLAVQAY
jgi:predicted nucleic acid-binding protein